MAGVSNAGEARAGTAEIGSFALKKALPLSLAGVIGVAGPLLSIDEASLPELLRKLRSMVEKSDSLPLEMIEADEEPETLRISGAVNACTLVVEINSVGREIKLRLIVP